MPIKGTYYNDTLGSAPTTTNTQLGSITTVTIPQGTLTSGDSNWQNSNSFGLGVGVYIMNASVNTAPGSASSATYLYNIITLSSASSNGGSNYFLQYDTTNRSVESFGNVHTYGGRVYTRFLVITTAAPTLFFSVTFTYTVAGSTQPQINPSTASFMRIA